MKKWKDNNDFKERVRDVAKNMEVNVKSLAIRPVKRKWASCSTDGNLNFNSELLNLRKDIYEYVIVHELLLHFNVPNHGKLWKSLITAHLGNYEKIERKLKKMAGKGK